MCAVTSDGGIESEGGASVAGTAVRDGGISASDFAAKAPIGR